MLSYVVQQNQGFGPPAIGVTDGVEDAVPDDRREQLLNEENQQPAADEREEEVVDEENRLQPEGLAVSHPLPAPEDDSIV